MQFCVVEFVCKRSFILNLKCFQNFIDRFLAQIDPQAAATGPTADLRFKNAADVKKQINYFSFCFFTKHISV